MNDKVLNSAQVEKLKEWVFKILDKNYIGDDDIDASNEHHRRVIGDILSYDGLALIVEKELPFNPHFQGDRTLYAVYDKAQEDMLKWHNESVISLVGGGKR